MIDNKIKEKDTLTINDMKELSHNIIDEELKKKGMICNIFPLTFVEYYKNIIPNKKYKLLDKISLTKLPFLGTAFTLNKNSQNEIIIFLNKFEKLNTNNNKLFYLIFTCYHETRHIMQKWLPLSNKDKYLADIEQVIASSLIYDDYTKNHDKYSYEIGANMYAITKTKEYLKENYTNIYEEMKNKIKKLDNKYRLDYFSYDATETIDRYIEVSKRKYQDLRISINKNKSLPTLNAVSKVFLNNDFSYKSIKEIINNENYKYLDKDLVYSFLASNSFLSSINMEALKQEELELLQEALKYLKEVYTNQEIMLEKIELEDNDNKIKKSQKEVNTKLKKFKEIFSNNYLRNENISKKHKKDIPHYLEESKKLVKKKNAGYIIISSFYVIAFLISMCIITYYYFLLNIFD